MLKRIRIKISQIHKRKGFIVLAIALLVVAVAIGIASLASYNFDKMIRTGLIKVSIKENNNNTPVIGSGIDLAKLPKTNMLKDSSFEPLVFRTSLTIESGTDKVIKVSNEGVESGLYTEGFFVGGQVRVTSLDDNSVVTKKTGEIVRYSPGKIDNFSISPVTGDIPSESKLFGLAVKGSKVVAVGENGIIITGINSQSPTVRYSGLNSDIIDICCNEKTFFACTEDGIIIFSDDSITWDNWIPPVNINLNSIAASANTVVAVGDGGKILLGLNGMLYAYDLQLQSDIVDVIFDSKKFIAVTSLGEILSSENGIIWTEDTKNNTGLKSITYADSIYVLYDEKNNVFVYSDINKSSQSINKIEKGIAGVAIVSKTKILLLTDDGDLLETNDYGSSWIPVQTRPDGKCNLIYSVGDSQIICSAGIQKTFLSRLVTEIEVDSKLQSGNYLPGEICYLSINCPDISDKLENLDEQEKFKTPWEYYGTGYAKKIIDEDIVQKGFGVLKLFSQANKGTGDYSVISQKITDESTGHGLIPGEFYIFTIWIKQETLSNEKIKIWISGGFENIGTEFTDIGAIWSKYTFKFAIPRDISKTKASELRINIGATGPGVFYLDQAYLAPVNEHESFAQLEFKKQLLDTEPSLIKMSWMGIGDSNNPENSWAYNGELDNALQLITSNSLNGAPWITVDSHASESELRNLIEYLSGPISSTYGDVRRVNGFPIPWSNVFEKIFIEFTDSEDIYDSDIGKAYYMNSCIKSVESSPYYSNIRSSIILVDNMKYADGLMLSRADYFSIDFQCDIEEITLSEILSQLEQMISVMPRNPDRPADVPFGIMRSTLLSVNEKEYGMGDYLVILLDTLGRKSAASLVTWEGISVDDISPALLAATKIASKSANGSKIKLEIENLNNTENLISAYAYNNDDDIFLVLVSHSDSPASINIDIPLGGRKASLYRYDSMGNILYENAIKRSGKNINIMPGNVVYIEMIQEPDDGKK